MTDSEELKEIKDKIDNSVLRDKISRLEQFLRDEHLKIVVDGLITTITTSDEQNIRCDIRTKSLNGNELDLDDVHIRCDGQEYDYFNYGTEIETQLESC